MVFAQDSSLRGPTIEASGAQLTVTNGEKIMVESIPKASILGAEFWLIGCLETIGTSFDFIPLGTYSREDPSSTGDKLKCHDLFKTYSRLTVVQPFCKDATLDVGVYDSVTDAAISESTVTIKADGSSFSQLLPARAGANPINMNGEYLVSVEVPGYISKMESITVNCDLNNCGSCKPSVMVSMSPDITGKPDQFRLTLSWAQGETDLDLFVVQRSVNDTSYSCKTYFNDNVDCAGVTMNKFNTAGSYNSETVTFNDNNNTDTMINMVYVKHNPCESPNDPREFLSSNPLLSISDGKTTTQLRMKSAFFNDEHYWLAGCIKASKNAFNAYKFVPVNAFLEHQPDTEVPDQCFAALGYNFAAAADKPWSILKPDTWFRG
jgi:hypothetical protein